MFLKSRNNLLVSVLLVLCLAVAFGCKKQSPPSQETQEPRELVYDFELVYRAGEANQTDAAADLTEQGFEAVGALGFGAFTLKTEGDNIILHCQGGGSSENAGSAKYVLPESFVPGTDATIIFRAKAYSAVVGFEVYFDQEGYGREKLYNEGITLKFDRTKSNTSVSGWNPQDWNTYRLTFAYDGDKNAQVNLYINESMTISHSAYADQKAEASYLQFGASSGSKTTEAAYDWLYLIKEGGSPQSKG